MFKLRKYTIIFLAAVVAVSEGCKKLEPINPACITIKSIKPASAHYGEIVEIKGDNFIPGHPQLYNIYIAGKLISDSYIVDVPDSGTLRFKIPEGIGSGKLSVSRVGAVPCNSVDSIEFTYQLTITGTKIFIPGNTLLYPAGLSVDRDGNVVLADQSHHQIKKFASNGQIIFTAGTGMSCATDQNGINTVCFYIPQDAAITSSTNIIYVADAGHNCIRRIKEGNVDTYGGAINNAGDNDGRTIAESRFTNPTGLVVDENGNFYTIESSKHRLRFVNTTENKVITLIGKSLPSPLNFPLRITYSKRRNPQYPVLVADVGNKRILQVNPTDRNNIKTISIDLDFNPYDLAVDQFGNIVVLDQSTNPMDNRILIIYKDNTIIDLRDEGLHYDFESLGGIAIDTTGNRIYISDQGTAHTIIEADYK